MLCWRSLPGASRAWEFWLDHKSFTESVSGTGRYPTHDPWGQPFTETYMKERMVLGGTLLAQGWSGCLAGVQCDQEYLVKMFRLNRASTKHVMEG